VFNKLVFSLDLESKGIARCSSFSVSKMLQIYVHEAYNYSKQLYLM